MKKWYFLGCALLICIVLACSGLLDSNDDPKELGDDLIGETDVPVVSDPGTVLGTVDFVQIRRASEGDIVAAGPFCETPLGTNHTLDLATAAMKGFSFLNGYPDHMIAVTLSHASEAAPLCVMFVDTTTVPDQTILFHRFFRTSTTWVLPLRNKDRFEGRLIAFYLDFARPDHTNPVTLAISGEGYSESMTIDPVANVVSTANLLKISRKNLPEVLPDSLYTQVCIDDYPVKEPQPHAVGFIRNYLDGSNILYTAANSVPSTIYMAVDPASWEWEMYYFVVFFQKNE